MNPSISIITSTLNAAETFAATAESIRRQTRREALQWLVADGVSVDHTVALIRQNADIIDFWHSQKDHGIYSAWNTLLPKMRGEWLLVLGADDTLAEPTTCALLIEQLAALPAEVGWVYAQVRVIGQGYQRLLGEPWEKIRGRFYHAMSVPHQGVLVRRSVIEKLGGFAEQYRIAGDFEYVVRLLKNGYKPVFISQIIVNMSAVGVSAKPQNGWQSSWELMRVRKHHNIRPFYPLPWIWIMIKAGGLWLIYTLLGKTLTQKFFRYFQLAFDGRATKHE